MVKSNFLRPLLILVGTLTIFRIPPGIVNVVKILVTHQKKLYRVLVDLISLNQLCQIEMFERCLSEKFETKLYVVNFENVEL